MTKALQDAFAATSRLPDEEQDSVAAAILKEAAVEEKWDASLSANSDALGRLADEALDDFRSGQTEPLDPKKLWGRGRHRGFGEPSVST